MPENRPGRTQCTAELGNGRQAVPEKPPQTSTNTLGVVERWFAPYLCIGDWRFQKFLEVFVPLLLLIARFAPLGDRLAVEDKDVEECVQQKNDIGFDGDTVQEHRLWWDVKCVRHQSRLNHGQGVVDVFLVEHMPV